jgi:hypothetical protein
MHGGLGGLYWFGKPDSAGMTFFVRGGVRYAAASAQTIQPHAGMGVLWRGASEFGVQFDYAIVPVGELGMFNYATLGIRLPPSVRRHEPGLAFEPVQMEEVSSTSEAASLPGEEILYFYPKQGEKARVAVDVQAPAEIGAVLLDAEGRVLVRTLIEKHVADPGRYQVAWDGTVGYGLFARFDIPYLIRITIGEATRDVKAVARERR